MDTSGHRHTHGGFCCRGPIHPRPETSHTHPTYRKNANVVHDALIPEGTWIWKDTSHTPLQALLRTMHSAITSKPTSPRETHSETHTSRTVAGVIMLPTLWVHLPGPKNLALLARVDALPSTSMIGWPTHPTWPKAPHCNLVQPLPNASSVARLRHKHISTQQHAPTLHS